MLRAFGRLAVHLERVEAAERAQHFEIVACAAADLEDAGIVGQVGLAADQVGEDPAAATYHQWTWSCSAMRSKTARSISRASSSAKPIFLRTT